MGENISVLPVHVSSALTHRGLWQRPPRQEEDFLDDQMAYPMYDPEYDERPLGPLAPPRLSDVPRGVSTYAMLNPVGPARASRASRQTCVIYPNGICTGPGLRIVSH
jgi:hypothetical protein